MRIETAVAGDIPQLCGLLSALFSQEAEFTPDGDAQRRGLERILGDPESGFVLVAREEGQILGMVNLLFTISTALGGRVGLLEDVVVLPSARGIGIGTKLLRETVSRARDQGCLRITLLTDPQNESARRFYQKHGFAVSRMVPMRLSMG